MTSLDILALSLRNLREARLRAALTTVGVVVGVAVIVTMVSFGLGLQRNTVQRFKDLDLFNEITVSGRSIASLISGGGEERVRGDGGEPGPRRPPGEGRGSKAARVLDDAAIQEIAQIPGVASVEPNVQFVTYVRANGRARVDSVGGALVPNAATRFKQFSAGRMIKGAETDEAVVDESFLRAYGFEKPSDALGKTLELLSPADEAGDSPRKPSPPVDATGTDDRVHETRGRTRGAFGVDSGSRGGGKQSREAEEAEDGPMTFFGLPLEEDARSADGPTGVVARTFKIVGVLKTEVEGGGRSFRGMMPVSSIYVSLDAARQWTRRHRNPLNIVALELARASGALKEGEAESYALAVVRVKDPSLLAEVQKQIADRGFGAFSIADQLKELRTVFLILNSALGLLGGISLLVASFGIANTMIMSILERTREIGIMKAIGAEDREIKLIFFVEAALIGLAGGVLGSLAAWGIDAAANRLAYRFILRPRGVSYVSFFALPPYLWLGAIAFAVVVAIIAALYPAARAARIDPVKALRHD